MTAGKRKSGRDAGQLREMVIERSLLNRADGSARWSQDQTSVVAAVWGPRLGKTRRQEDPQRANIEVVFKPKVGLQGSLEHEYERVIRQTLEAAVMRAAHPRCVVQVVLQVVSDDGGALACAINAACAALVDAGVPMSAQIAAVSLAVGDGGGVTLDPDRSEEAAAQAVATLAFPSRGPPRATGAGGGGDEEGEAGGGEAGAIASFTRGSMAVDEYLACLEMGRAGAEGVSSFSRLSLQRYQRGAEMSAQ